MSKNMTSEEKKRLKKVKETIEDNSVEAPEIKGIGDMINFKSLYKIPGRPKIWTCITGKVSKGGMIAMVEYLNPHNRLNVKRTTLICLADFWFQTKTLVEVENNGVKTDILKKLNIAEVFNNLNTHFIDVDVSFETHQAELMELMVPNYDENEFKPYHLKKVIPYYNEIKNKVIAAEKLDAFKKQEEAENAD